MALLITTLMLYSQLWASDLVVGGSIGLPQLELENPDASKAKYDGLSFRLGVEVPIYGSKTNFLSLSLGYQSFMMDNTRNSSQQKEAADHKGYYAGILITFGKFLFGTNFQMMKAEHISSGLHTYNLDYDYNSIEYLLGLRFANGPYAWGLTYSMVSGSIDKKDLSTLSDADLQMNILWLNVSYSFSSFFRN